MEDRYILALTWSNIVIHYAGLLMTPQEDTVLAISTMARNMKRMTKKLKECFVEYLIQCRANNSEKARRLQTYASLLVVGNLQPTSALRMAGGQAHWRCSSAKLVTEFRTSLVW